MRSIKRKMAGVYIIEHKSGFFYVGKSLDIFARWSSHYTSIRMKRHHSARFQDLWLETEAEDWSFSILAYVSLDGFKKSNPGLRGKALTTAFSRHLIALERNEMSKLMKKFALNADSKYFRDPV